MINADILADSMFFYERLRYEWMYMAFAGGIILILSTALVLIEVRKPRRPVKRKDVEPYSKSFIPYVPWVLWGTYAVILAALAWPFIKVLRGGV